MSDEVLAVVEASAPRRWLAIFMLGALGALLFYVALATPPALGWQLFLIGAGGVSVWLALRLYRATEHRIELTATHLRSSAGDVIAEIADIEGLDRGAFAFKPSNGFLLRTKNPGGRSWQPGLWWRLGRRIGIGGVTPGSQGRFMAEAIATLMAGRD
ncbi:hypothetical protein M3P21_14605 [Ruegeria sp. 2012CJ41-6]|uniref:DUF2244 domain-containing protein n=1 Tax=Ruegeria spongiae TaxID=2942209 RepID=A0ABT0Q4N0_9RHOB|nr:hypothetical protein [Ruegeria spongiae]MCL6284765.1 hypothetical protein [Ruegeria spongiae]